MSKFDVGVFLNNPNMKLRNMTMSLCVENCKDINTCYNEFKIIFSRTVFHHASIKLITKKVQKLNKNPR